MVSKDKRLRKQELERRIKNNVFKGLGINTLEFFLDRTDFKEPWNGVGFATKVKEDIEKAHSLKVAKKAIEDRSNR